MGNFEQGPEFSPSESSFEAEMAVQRGIIDVIDRQLVSLINIRAEAALEVGSIKARHGKPIYVKSREDEVISKVCAINEENGSTVPDEDIEILFRAIMKTSRAAQQREHDAKGLDNTSEPID